LTVRLRKRVLEGDGESSVEGHIVFLLDGKYPADGSRRAPEMTGNISGASSGFREAKGFSSLELVEGARTSPDSPAGFCAGDPAPSAIDEQLMFHRSKSSKSSKDGQDNLAGGRGALDAELQYSGVHIAITEVADPSEQLPSVTPKTVETLDDDCVSRSQVGDELVERWALGAETRYQTCGRHTGAPH
jgi:hypothetical protein